MFAINELSLALSILLCMASLMVGNPVVKEYVLYITDLSHGQSAARLTSQIAIHIFIYIIMCAMLVISAHNRLAHGVRLFDGANLRAIAGPEQASRTVELKGTIDGTERSRSFRAWFGPCLRVCFS